MYDVEKNANYDREMRYTVLKTVSSVQPATLLVSP